MGSRSGNHFFHFQIGCIQTPSGTKMIRCVTSFSSSVRNWPPLANTPPYIVSMSFLGILQLTSQYNLLATATWPASQPDSPRSRTQRRQRRSFQGWVNRTLDLNGGCQHDWFFFYSCSIRLTRARSRFVHLLPPIEAKRKGFMSFIFISRPTAEPNAL